MSWSDLHEVAVACGAFPFAFRPRQIKRDANEYVNRVTPLWPRKASLATPGTTYVTRSPEQPWSFACTDGGVLQNRPMGIAKDLVDVSLQQRLGIVRRRKTLACRNTESAVLVSRVNHCQESF